MNEQLVSRIKHLYKLFQFEDIAETNDYIVFRFNSGYFNIVEILVFNNTEAIQKAKKEHEEVGFIVQIKQYSDYNSLHDSLYKGFFYLDRKRVIFKNYYKRYCEQQTNHIQQFSKESSYTYINSNYFRDGTENSAVLYESIGREMLEDGNKLLIMEASAGMGKTSTAYEIFNYILQQNHATAIPLLIELTRNRGARIFRHVLDDEIDRNFTGLKRDLIIEEIRLGNILLIIDGFDELLSREKNDEDEDEGVGQSMLDTIAELLTEDSNARITLTSRKSAMFIGDKFEYWQEHVLPNVRIMRYQLTSPTVADWLDPTRIEVLDSKGILVSLSNPVLLSILRYLPIDEFEHFNNGASIVNLYLTKLLDRERDRQKILLSVDEQLLVFTKLAAQFVQLEIMAEEPEMIKIILLESVFANDITKYMNLYTESAEKPQDEDEFAYKFVHHALMDRIKPFSNKLGFINEFVFGIFISKAITAGLLGEETTGLLNEKYISLAVESFLIESEKKRKDFYNRIQNLLYCLDSKQVITMETALLGNSIKNYSADFFDYIIFKNCAFTTGTFINCTFSACIFQNCTFDSKLFTECYFFNCQFYNNTLSNNILLRNSIFLSNCTGTTFFENAEVASLPHQNTSVDFRKAILENFWNPGKARADSRRSLISIFKGIQPNDRRKVAAALDELVKEKILTTDSGYYNLNHKKMDIIKTILGR